jgi:hypothetical protein
MISAAEGFDPNPVAEDQASEESEVLGKGPRTAIWIVVALVTAVASMLRTCIE